MSNNRASLARQRKRIARDMLGFAVYLGKKEAKRYRKGSRKFAYACGAAAALLSYARLLDPALPDSWAALEQGRGVYRPGNESRPKKKER